MKHISELLCLKNFSVNLGKLDCLELLDELCKIEKANQKWLEKGHSFKLKMTKDKNGCFHKALIN